MCINHVFIYNPITITPQIKLGQILLGCFDKLGFLQHVGIISKLPQFILEFLSRTQVIHKKRSL